MKVFLAFGHTFPLLCYRFLFFLHKLFFFHKPVLLWFLWFFGLLCLPSGRLPLFWWRYLFHCLFAFVNLHTIEHFLLLSSLSLVVFMVLAFEGYFMLLFWLGLFLWGMRLCWLFFNVFLYFGWFEVFGWVFRLCKFGCFDTLRWTLWLC